jgi:hypothetical protein
VRTPVRGPLGLPPLKPSSRSPGPPALAFAIPSCVPRSPTLLSNWVPLCNLTWLTPKRTSFSKFELNVWLQSMT